MAASERHEDQRTAWRADLARVNPHRLVFVAESRSHTSFTRLYGWAPHDQRATGQVPRHHGKNPTFVAALTWEGVQAPWTIEGAMDTAAFAVYVRCVLVPTLRPSQIVVMDNLSVHKAARSADAIRGAGCTLLFFPASSPDCNPIEVACSQLKAVLRTLASRTRDTLLTALAIALDAITSANASAWFHHAGYLLPAPSSCKLLYIAREAKYATSTPRLQYQKFRAQGLFIRGQEPTQRRDADGPPQCAERRHYWESGSAGAA